MLFVPSFRPPTKVELAFRAQRAWLESDRAAPVTLPYISFLDPLNRLPFEHEDAPAKAKKPRLTPGRNGQRMPRFVCEVLKPEDLTVTGGRRPRRNGSRYNGKLLQAAA